MGCGPLVHRHVDAERMQPKGLQLTGAVDVETSPNPRRESSSSSSSNLKSAMDKILRRPSKLNDQSTRVEGSNSLLEFASPNQTIIIFDWDDTLCPSTILRRGGHVQWAHNGRLMAKVQHDVQKEIRVLAGQVLLLLQAAVSLGQVVIVTNAKRPWVDMACRTFMPELQDILDKIPIMYAIELVQDAEQFQQHPTASKENVFTETKARAMKEALSNFYSRYPNQSWKNVVSIGDAFFEHDAIRQVTAGRPCAEKPCRTKTIKMLEGPTIECLVVQLAFVKSWLGRVVELDKGLDIDLSAEEGAMRSWARQLGSFSA